MEGLKVVLGIVLAYLPGLAFMGLIHWLWLIWLLIALGIGVIGGLAVSAHETRFQTIMSNDSELVTERVRAFDPWCLLGLDPRGSRP